MVGLNMCDWTSCSSETFTAKYGGSSHRRWQGAVIHRSALAKADRCHSVNFKYKLSDFSSIICPRLIQWLIQFPRGTRFRKPREACPNYSLKQYKCSIIQCSNSDFEIYFEGVRVSIFVSRDGFCRGVEPRSSNLIFGELFSGCSNFEFMLMTNHESRIPEAFLFCVTFWTMFGPFEVPILVKSDTQQFSTSDGSGIVSDEALELELWTCRR